MMLTILILQTERVKVKPIFYDANQTWQKIEGSLVTLSSNTVVMDLKHSLKRSRAEELCEIEESS